MRQGGHEEPLVVSGGCAAIEWKNFQKPCIMHQDDEYGKNVLDGFNQQLTAMKVLPASVTSYKRGA
jgi:branched-chain amino acid transport system substrate-binding protein